jgi:hypothetical protein
MNKQIKADEILREFAPSGKYRIRLLTAKDGERFLDIREYVSTEDFEGFTRRGVRLPVAHLADLASIIAEVIR